MFKGEDKLLMEGCKILGININEFQVEVFIRYMEILLEKNKRINITSITDRNNFIIKHFLDSLTCFAACDFQGRIRVMDVGTGGGFPGLPIKILRPHIELTLLDSAKKRIDFLKDLLVELRIGGVRLIHGRAEEYGRNKDFRETYDVVVSRAVAPLKVLAEYCLPFLKKGGIFIAQKAKDAVSELEEGKRALEVLGGLKEKEIRLNLPFTGDERNIIVIKKTKPTPDRYPRKPGVPMKRPL
jgi:16S rRNA (guanine527-N7)-methyltransferase